MTDSSQTRHAIIAETNPGVTPTTPAFQVIRVIGGGLTDQQGFSSSDEIRSDRNAPDVTPISLDYSGEFPFEFSYGSFDDLLAYFLCADWSSNVIKNGVLHKTFTYEKTDKIGASTFDFERFKGCMVNTMNLDVSARSKLTGSFGIIAATADAPASSIITGATYVAANTNPIMSGSGDVGALTIAGSAGPKIMSINFQGTNNINVRPVVGSKESNGLRKGQFVFSGSLNAYFDDTTLRDLYKAGNYVDLSIVIGVGANKKYTISLPKTRLLNAPKSLPGNNEDIMLNVEFQAVYDTTELASVKVTRVP